MSKQAEIFRSWDSMVQKVEGLEKAVENAHATLCKVREENEALKFSVGQLTDDLRKCRQRAQLAIETLQ